MAYRQKDLNIVKDMSALFQKFDVTSWYPILIGTILIWFIGCSQTCADFIAAQKGTAAILLAALYLILIVYLVFLKGKRDTKTILGLIFLGGFLLRAYYVLAAPYSITAHDLGSFTGLDTMETGGGHLGYIDYIYKNHHLPDFDPRTRWSFYNPPGFYVFEVAVLGITRIFGVAEPLCYESLQVLTLLFSCLTVWMGYRILKEFKICDKWVLLLTAVLSVHPFFSIMAVTLTNDCMAMYFMTLAVWYTIRWQKSPDFKKILVIALAVGMGMCAKLNVGVLAFGIGAVFICVFFKNRREWKKYIVWFAAFLAVCAPLGLFGPVRNMIHYDMPLTYIQQVGTDDWKYIADQTFLTCFGFPSLKEMSYPFITFEPAVERNAWMQALRTALFDEIRPDVGNSLFGPCGLVLLWVSMVLAILMNIGFIWSICKKNTMVIEQKLLLALSYAVLLISYGSFCMKEPFTFTMEYRYISIAIFFPVIGTALWMQHGEDNKLFQKKGYCQIVKNILICGMICFIALAVIVDLNLISWSNITL